MSDRIPASPGEDGTTPVPRDLPDQQATDEPDAWDLDVSKAAEDADADAERGDGHGDKAATSPTRTREAPQGAMTPRPGKTTRRNRCRTSPLGEARGL